jgi:hypothetical protein
VIALSHLEITRLVTVACFLQPSRFDIDIDINIILLSHTTLVHPSTLFTVKRQANPSPSAAPPPISAYPGTIL